MQLVETRVERADGGRLQVRFQGEGGDMVLVTIPDGSSCTSAGDAISRAKAMMVQITAFDEPPDDAGEAVYDQTRGGDEKSYRLEYSEGEHVRRMPQVSFESDEAARIEVERSAIDLVASPDTPPDAHGWAVRAVDADDNVVASLTFEEARRLRSRREQL